jgi:hypothetical protein
MVRCAFDMYFQTVHYVCEATEQLGLKLHHFEVSRLRTQSVTQTLGSIHMNKRSVRTSQRPLPIQHTTNTSNEFPRYQRDSNPRSEQSSGHRLMPYTAEPPGLEWCIFITINIIYLLIDYLRYVLQITLRENIPKDGNILWLELMFYARNQNNCQLYTSIRVMLPE